VKAAFERDVAPRFGNSFGVGREGVQVALMLCSLVEKFLTEVVLTARASMSMAAKPTAIWRVYVSMRMCSLRIS
jgi:hypothetical protein